MTTILAETEGFEPLILLQICRFSRPVPSAARPRFRNLVIESSAKPESRKYIKTSAHALHIKTPCLGDI